MKDFEIYECEECYALIPYPGCKHNCPEIDSVDEGFEECPLELILFIQKLKIRSRLNELMSLLNEMNENQ